MDGYGDLLDDDGDETPDVGADLAALSWQAGYGAALLDAQREASGECWADRIVDAADKLSGRDFFGESP